MKNIILQKKMKGVLVDVTVELSEYNNT